MARFTVFYRRFVPQSGMAVIEAESIQAATEQALAQVAGRRRPPVSLWGPCRDGSAYQVTAVRPIEEE